MTLLPVGWVGDGRAARGRAESPALGPRGNATGARGPRAAGRDSAGGRRVGALASRPSGYGTMLPEVTGTERASGDGETLARVARTARDPVGGRPCSVVTAGASARSGWGTARADRPKPEGQKRPEGQDKPHGVQERRSLYLVPVYSEKMPSST